MVSSNEEVAMLVGQTGPLNGQRWPLWNPLLIGRDPTCDIVVADRQVSRHHARLTPTSKGVLLEDLKSKNGTHWNGLAITESILLQDGDLIQIALAQKFVFLSSDATVPLDMPDIEVDGMSRLDTSYSSEAQPSAERLRLDKKSRRVWIRIKEAEPLSSSSPGIMHPATEREVLPPLSVAQFRLLELLYNNPGRVVSRQDLISTVWGEEQAIAVSEQALDALVRRLRERLSSIDPSHNYIVTIRGHGLRIDNPS